MLFFDNKGRVKTEGHRCYGRDNAEECKENKRLEDLKEIYTCSIGFPSALFIYILPHTRIHSQWICTKVRQHNPKFWEVHRNEASRWFRLACTSLQRNQNEICQSCKAVPFWNLPWSQYLPIHWDGQALNNVDVDEDYSHYLVCVGVLLVLWFLLEVLLKSIYNTREPNYKLLVIQLI